MINFEEIESIEQLKSYDNYHFLIALLNPLYDSNQDDNNEKEQEEEG